MRVSFSLFVEINGNPSLASSKNTLIPYGNTPSFIPRLYLLSIAKVETQFISEHNTGLDKDI